MSNVYHADFHNSKDMYMGKTAQDWYLEHRREQSKRRSAEFGETLERMRAQHHQVRADKYKKLYASTPEGTAHFKKVTRQKAAAKAVRTRKKNVRKESHAATVAKIRGKMSKDYYFRRQNGKTVKVKKGRRK